MTSPLVTVGIPFFNEERFLGAAVRSVLGQTLRHLDVVLVDDGSTDDSLAIARSFDDPRVRVLSDGRRLHLAARLNEIARTSRGEFIARMDADDIAHPERLEHQVQALRADPRCAAVGSWIGLIDEDERLFAVGEASLPTAGLDVIERGLLPHATLVAHRDWVLDNPYDESLSRAEDRDLWCRTFATTRFAIVPEVLYVVRVLAEERTFLPKYLAAQRDNRRLYLRYGPESIGRAATGRLWMAAHAKGFVMRAAVATGLTSRVLARRGRAPTPAETARVRETVDASRQ